MAFRLNKKQQQEVSSLSAELALKAEAIATAVAEYNDVLTRIRTLRDSLVEDWQAQIDEKSERWQESDAAASATSLKDEWEGADFDDIEEPSMDHQETLDGLPLEVS